MRAVKRIMAAAALSAALAPAMAEAQYWRGSPADRGSGAPRGYGRGGYPPRAYAAPGYGYRGDDGRRRGTRCDHGTGGTIIGAIAGGLLGNSVAGRGDRGPGTIVGAGMGALAGRAIDRDC